MRKINSAEFRKAIGLDPAWATTLTRPVEITDYCHMPGTAITHLSPLLHFTGRDNKGNVADFSGCHQLQTAAGTFHGGVDFTDSAISKIGDIIVTSNTAGHAASFEECKNLEVAEGRFAGTVDFSYSGITKIGALAITKTEPDGMAAGFRGCKSLIIAEGKFPGYVEFSDSGIQQIGELAITKANNSGWAANFGDCKKLETAEGAYPGFVNFAKSGIRKIGKLQTKPTENGVCADFTDCDIRLPKEYLGHEYIMHDTDRKQNLNRIAVGAAQRATPNLEI